MRQQANLAGGEVHQVFFNPATSLPGSSNTVVFDFPDGDDGQWCRTAGVDLSVSGISSPEGVTENATPLPGTLTADCVQGSGSSSVDTITVSGVGPLVAGTLYGWSVTDGSIAKLGTPPPAQGLIVNLTTTNGVTPIDTFQFFLSVLSSDQVVVSAEVVETTPPGPTNPTVIFSGYAAPTATVTINRNGQLVNTTPADAQARFSITLSDQPTGAVVYEVDGTDDQQNVLSPVTFALTLSPSTTTFISGVFLGPSIAINTRTVKIGTPVLISGTTTPDSALTLTVHSVQATSFTLNPDDQGRWSKSVDTTALGVGTHTAQARAVLGGSVASEASAVVTFAVNPLGLFDGKPPADLNGDGQVNIVDFSILLFFWRQTNPSNSRADINHDGRVDLTDFSIMLFQWTG